MSDSLVKSCASSLTRWKSLVLDDLLSWNPCWRLYRMSLFLLFVKDISDSTESGASKFGVHVQ